MMKPPMDNETMTLPERYHWGWGVIFAVITVVTVALRYSLPIRDGDVWWHMLYGKYFLDNNTLIADHTIFSWTPTTNDTIYCTWLPDILLYLIHKFTGLPGLFAFRYLCLYSFVFVCFWYARRLGKASHPLVWLVILVGILMGYTAVFIKPEIISFVLMTLLVWNWWRIRTGGKHVPYLCYGIPLIMLVWVNSHGAFIFGFIFLACVTLGEILNTWWSHGNVLPAKVRKHLWTALALSLLVTLVNPYGWHYPFQLFFDLLPTSENMSYNSKVASYIPTFTFKETFHRFSLFADIAVLIVAVLSLLQMKQKKAEWSSLISSLVFVLLYSRYFRTTFYLAPVFAFSSMYMLSTLAPLDRFGPGLKNKVKFFFPAVMLVAMLYLSLSTLHNAFRNPENDVVPGNFGIACPNPVDEAEYIQKYFPKAVIGNSYSVGAYLLWTLWPDNKVFFDSRHFPYKSWSDDFFASLRAKGLDEMLEKYPADVWIFNHSETIWSSYFRFSPNWKLAYYGRCAEVFADKDMKLPGDGKYQVSSRIEEIRSRITAFQVFIFALAIHDWDTAESMITVQKEKLSETVKGKNQKHIVTAYQDLLAGMKAFVNKDYSLALDKIDKYRDGLPGLGGFVVVSHLNLAQQALDENKLALAEEHVQMAVDLLPNALYTQFDAGLVAWLLGQRKVGDDSSQKSPVWEENFRNFIRLAGKNKDFLKEEIDFAEAVLARKVKPGPEPSLLLVPELKNLIE